MESVLQSTSEHGFDIRDTALMVWSPRDPQGSPGIPRDPQGSQDDDKFSRFTGGMNFHLDVHRGTRVLTRVVRLV